MRRKYLSNVHVTNAEFLEHIQIVASGVVPVNHQLEDLGLLRRDTAGIDEDDGVEFTIGGDEEAICAASEEVLAELPEADSAEVIELPKTDQEVIAIGR